MPRKRQCQGLKRKYDAAFKEEVLNSLRTTCGGNVSAAARLHDVPEQTLRVVVSVVDAITASVKSVEVLDTTVDLLVYVVNRSYMTPL